MKKEITDIPEEIAEILAGIPKTTPEMLERIAAANRKLENDPEFLADVERAKFVNGILEAMQTTDTSKSQLAKRIGKTRQYITKVLDEDARVSFTLKTMVSLCHALGYCFETQISKRPTTYAHVSIKRDNPVKTLPGFNAVAKLDSHAELLRLAKQRNNKIYTFTPPSHVERLSA